MSAWTRLALALALIAERIALWLETRARKQEAERQAKELEQLRDGPVDWWQRNFGVDGGNDSRLSDAAGETRPDAAEAATRDRAD